MSISAAFGPARGLKKNFAASKAAAGGRDLARLRPFIGIGARRCPAVVLRLTMQRLARRRCASPGRGFAPHREGGRIARRRRCSSPGGGAAPAAVHLASQRRCASPCASHGLDGGFSPLHGAGAGPTALRLPVTRRQRWALPGGGDAALDPSASSGPRRQWPGTPAWAGMM